MRKQRAKVALEYTKRAYESNKTNIQSTLFCSNNKTKIQKESQYQITKEKKSFLFFQFNFFFLVIDSLMEALYRYNELYSEEDKETCAENDVRFLDEISLKCMIVINLLLK